MSIPFLLSTFCKKLLPASGKLVYFKLIFQNQTMHCSHITAQKMKFSITDFFSKCDQIRRKLKFTEEICNGKLHFLCSVCWRSPLYWFASSYLIWTQILLLLERMGKGVFMCLLASVPLRSWRTSRISKLIGLRGSSHGLEKFR